MKEQSIIDSIKHGPIFGLHASIDATVLKKLMNLIEPFYFSGSVEGCDP